MTEILDEIISKLNMCSLDGNSLILDNIYCKILLDYITKLQETKEDLEFHNGDLENTIKEIFNEGFLEYDEENQEFVYQPCYVNESIEKIKKIIEGD